MTKVIKRIGNHNLEANYSNWTSCANIKLDGIEIFSKMIFISHKESVDVDNRTFKICFSGAIANISIDEIINHINK